MSFPSKVSSWTAFGLLMPPLLAGPWMFGAWEMWWFWPFAFCIFAATGFLGLQRILCARRSAELEAGIVDTEARTNKRLCIGLALSFLPFLVYATVRSVQESVYMDAERMLLLVLLPVLVGCIIVFGLNSRQRRWMTWLLIVNLAALGIYGILNHLINGSKTVLWVEAYPQYLVDHRACGSYFCPDHYAGIMEIALAIGLGFLLARNETIRHRLTGTLLAIIGVWGVYLSKSRGGGLTVLVILSCGFVWGLSQWPPRVRWIARSLAVVLVAAGLALLISSPNDPYVQRFQKSFINNKSEAATFREMGTMVAKELRKSSRGHMISAALRAWHTNPFWGIGPGMHQNLWPHFAASPDGDRETGKWPTFPNYSFHSYEVHSDWVQILEETGVAGFLLFLLPCFWLAAALIVPFRREVAARKQNEWRGTGQRTHAMILGAIFAYIAMAFHSLGDFNMQMPATGWLFAAWMALALGQALCPRGRCTQE